VQEKGFGERFGGCGISSLALRFGLLWFDGFGAGHGGLV
jgi:hypothetical protein